jgi:hypothetical protein
VNAWLARTTGVVLKEVCVAAGELRQRLVRVDRPNADVDVGPVR